VNFRFGLGCLFRSMNIGCFGSKVTHSLRIVLVLHVVHSQNSCQSERCLFPMFPTSWRCDQADRWESRFCPVLCRNNLCTTPFPVNSGVLVRVRNPVITILHNFTAVASVAMASIDLGVVALPLRMTLNKSPFDLRESPVIFCGPTSGIRVP